MRLIMILAAIVALAGSAGADEVVLNPDDAPYYDIVRAYAIDQPLLYTLFLDGGAPMTNSSGEALAVRSYIDTGASGVVMSKVTADELGIGGDPYAPSGDYVAAYEEIGIGGTEPGGVTRPLGVGVCDSNLDPLNEANYQSFDDLGLWVRQQADYTEYLLEPINIVGMPVIEQRVMVMDLTPIANVEPMNTYLLAKGESSPLLPTTNATLAVEMVDYSSAAPEQMATADNPMVTNIAITGLDDGSNPHTAVNQKWLYDTGAGSSFISVDVAHRLGLLPLSVSAEDLAYYATDEHDGPVMEVGGIGGDSLTVPIFQAEEVRIPAAEGFDIVWRDVEIGVLDVAGLDGIFGMNMLVPAITPDALGGIFSPTSPGYFDSVVFETTDPGAGELRLYSSIIAAGAAPGGGWLTGDANGDGAVDDADYTLWADHYGQDKMYLQTGDFNGDGIVDDADYTLWADHYGQTALTPEPAGMALVMMGSAVLLLRKKSGKSLSV